MITEFIAMNGYGLYVWLSFSIVFISCALFILKQKKLSKKQTFTEYSNFIIRRKKQSFRKF